MRLTPKKKRTTPIHAHIIAHAERANERTPVTMQNIAGDLMKNRYCSHSADRNEDLARSSFANNGHLLAVVWHFMLATCRQSIYLMPEI